MESHAPSLAFFDTPTVRIAYEDRGPRDGRPIFLLHGWPDDVRAWREIAPHLHADGYRTIAPYLRGYGPSTFVAEAVRDGRSVALASDALALADGLGIETFDAIGHDWGARAAYSLAALAPSRVRSIVALALGFQPHGRFAIPPFDQARRFWYQFFMCTDGGAATVRADPRGFARYQWETWSPAGWFDETEFARTAESFENPAWADVTLNGYRSRFVADEPVDPQYDSLSRRLETIATIDVPTLVIHGAADTCVGPETTESLDRFFTRDYRRIVVPGVGHFVPREAPEVVATATLAHLARVAI